MKITAEILNQDKVWVDRNGMVYQLETMDPHYRSNLIPFLRGNARRLQEIAEDHFYEITLGMGDSDGVANALASMEASFEAPAEAWLERTPLMRKLVALEAGIPLATRKLWAIKNKAYEIRHNYKKIRTN